MPQSSQTPDAGQPDIILARDIRVGMHLVIPMTVLVETVTWVHLDGHGYVHLSTDASGYMWLETDTVRTVPARTPNADDGEVR